MILSLVIIFTQKTIYVPALYQTINNISQTQHDLGIYNFNYMHTYMYVYVTILREGSHHDVETSA